MANVTTSIQGFSVQGRTYQNIKIDGTVYNGSTDFNYFRIDAPGDRIICLGFISSSTNTDIWGKFINTNKLVVQKAVNGTWSDFTSI